MYGCVLNYVIFFCDADRAVQEIDNLPLELHDFTKKLLTVISTADILNVSAVDITVYDRWCNDGGKSSVNRRCILYSFISV